MKSLLTISGLTLAAALAAGAIGPTAPATAAEKLTIWSHWADEQNKKDFVMEAVKRFKAKNSGFDVEVVWYQKPQLITALTTSFQAGTGPDIFYLEPAITGAFPPYVDYGFMYDISKQVDAYIEPWAHPFAKKGSVTYLLPLEAYMPVLYYNKDVFKAAGVALPADGRIDGDALKAIVAKTKAAGATPFSAGTMDRDWAGSLVTESILLRYLGEEKWQGIPTGKTAWTDPDVVAGLKYVEDLVKAGAYPQGVASIKLGESHGLFFGGKYAVFPMRTFFGGRAFVPVAQGGMAADFPLGVLDFPTIKGGKGNDLSYMQVGGSYGVNARSKNAQKAAELIGTMATPDMAALWMSSVKGQTGVKADAQAMNDPYFKMLADATKGIKFLPGPMELGMDPSYRDVFFKTSTALVAGHISADAMIKQLEDARGKLKK
jgi:raffinose/stachyose/melibiose transport system substrate-binding protein